MPFIEDEHTRAKLMKAGFGRGFPFWAAAVALQAERLVDLLRRYEGEFPVPFTVSGQHRFTAWHVQALADVHYLLLGVRHILRYAREFKRLIGNVDPRLGVAINTFMTGCGKQAETFRGVLEHWDEYSLGDKKLPREMTRPPDEFAGQVQVIPRDDELYISYAGIEFPAVELITDTLQLAEALELSWSESITAP